MNMQKISPRLIAALLALAAGSGASAATFVVDARVNSTSGGVALDTVSLNAGDSFSISAGVTDLWSAGPLPRYSNADGLVRDLFATGSDESGQPAGTLIGTNFGSLSQNGFSAAYGTLVGQIGSGSYFTVGTSFNGIAATSGLLRLSYWDSSPLDNTGTVSANISAVPEPASAALVLAGLAVVGARARSKRS